MNRVQENSHNNIIKTTSKNNVYPKIIEKSDQFNLPVIIQNKKFNYIFSFSIIEEKYQNQKINIKAKPYINCNNLEEMKKNLTRVSYMENFNLNDFKDISGYYYDKKNLSLKNIYDEIIQIVKANKYKVTINKYHMVFYYYLIENTKNTDKNNINNLIVLCLDNENERIILEKYYKNNFQPVNITKNTAQLKDNIFNEDYCDNNILNSSNIYSNEKEESSKKKNISNNNKENNDNKENQKEKEKNNSKISSGKNTKKSLKRPVVQKESKPKNSKIKKISKNSDKVNNNNNDNTKKKSFTRSPSREEKDSITRNFVYGEYDITFEDNKEEKDEKKHHFEDSSDDESWGESVFFEDEKKDKEKEEEENNDSKKNKNLLGNKRSREKTQKKKSKSNNKNDLNKKNKINDNNNQLNEILNNNKNKNIENNTQLNEIINNNKNKNIDNNNQLNDILNNNKNKINDNNNQSNEILNNNGKNFEERNIENNNDNNDNNDKNNVSIITINDDDEEYEYINKNLNQNENQQDNNDNSFIDKYSSINDQNIINNKNIENLKENLNNNFYKNDLSPYPSPQLEKYLSEKSDIIYSVGEIKLIKDKIEPYNNLFFNLVYTSKKNKDNYDTFRNLVKDKYQLLILIKTNKNRRIGLYFNEKLFSSKGQENQATIDMTSFIYSFDKNKFYCPKERIACFIQSPTIPYLFKLTDHSIIIKNNFMKEIHYLTKTTMIFNIKDLSQELNGGENEFFISVLEVYEAKIREL